MSATGPVANIDEHCERLQRDARARAVLVISDEGAILGHAGELASLPDHIFDTAGDLVVSCLGESAARGDLQEGVVSEGEKLSVCAAPVGPKAVLAVVYDASSNLGLVRTRMKGVLEVLARSLSEP